jgi:uncharacterized protein
MSQHTHIIKCNAEGVEVFRYTGNIVRRQKDSFLVEAFFTHPDFIHFGMPLCKSDRFLELYFTNRWYNIFEIHDREDDRLKGWYCNVTYPAKFNNGSITFLDLALDLLVFPDGRQLVLDEDEFAELKLPTDVIHQAKAALTELQDLLSNPEDFLLEAI